MEKSSEIGNSVTRSIFHRRLFQKVSRKAFDFFAVERYQKLKGKFTKLQ